MKKILLFLLLGLLLQLPQASFAGESKSPQDLKPLAFQYLSIAESLMFVNTNNTISVSGETGAYSAVNKITVTVYLEKYSGGKWATVKSWSFSKSNNSEVIGTATSGTLSEGTYRVRSYHRIDHNGSVETTTSYSSSQKI
jgi:hypothetical protein